jgi:hypothetical protein
MGKQKTKRNYRRIVLRWPDLDHSQLALLNSLTSPSSRRVYQYAIDQIIAWYCSEPHLAFNRIVVVRNRMHLESRGLAAKHYLGRVDLDSTHHRRTDLPSGQRTGKGLGRGISQSKRPSSNEGLLVPCFIGALVAGIAENPVMHFLLHVFPPII